MKSENNARDEIEQLIWSVVDGVATEQQQIQLEKWISEDAQAREIYVTCMQLHADLHFLFSLDNPQTERGNPSILPQTGPLPLAGDSVTPASD